LDNTVGYIAKLRDDLPEQFKDKDNIRIFNEALGRQLDELYKFYYDLNILRSLQTAEGAQLDGIGDIVCLSRAEALIISKMANMLVPMDDAMYRLYLTWKINLNTSNCTYRDVHRALKMFWDKPLYYEEIPEHPATMFFKTHDMSPEEDASVLLLAPKIKAGGVALKIWIIIAANYEVTNYHYGAMSELIEEYYESEE